MDRQVFGAGVALGTVLGLMLAGFILAAQGALPNQIAENLEATGAQWERAAVQHHAAEWYVDEDGERAFRWLEREPETKEAAETPRVR